MFAIEVSGLAAKLSGDSDGAFAFQKADDCRDLLFWRYFNEHMDMVGHEMTLQDSAIFLGG